MAWGEIIFLEKKLKNLFSNMLLPAAFVEFRKSEDKNNEFYKAPQKPIKGAKPRSLWFPRSLDISGGSEGNNLAVKGFYSLKDDGKTWSDFTEFSVDDRNVRIKSVDGHVSGTPGEKPTYSLKQVLGEFSEEDFLRPVNEGGLGTSKSAPHTIMKRLKTLETDAVDKAAMEANNLALKNKFVEKNGGIIADTIFPPNIALGLAADNNMLIQDYSRMPPLYSTFGMKVHSVISKLVMFYENTKMYMKNLWGSRIVTSVNTSANSGGLNPEGNNGFYNVEALNQYFRSVLGYDKPLPNETGKVKNLVDAATTFLVNSHINPQGYMKDVWLNPDDDGYHDHYKINLDHIHNPNGYIMRIRADALEVNAFSNSLTEVAGGNAFLIIGFSAVMDEEATLQNGRNMKIYYGVQMAIGFYGQIFMRQCPFHQNGGYFSDWKKVWDWYQA